MPEEKHQSNNCNGKDRDRYPNGKCTTPRHGNENRTRLLARAVCRLQRGAWCLLVTVQHSDEVQDTRVAGMGIRRRCPSNRRRDVLWNAVEPLTSKRSRIAFAGSLVYFRSTAAQLCTGQEIAGYRCERELVGNRTGAAASKLLRGNIWRRE